jgi:hypothetical protein
MTSKRIQTRSGNIEVKTCTKGGFQIGVENLEILDEVILPLCLEELRALYVAISIVINESDIN